MRRSASGPTATVKISTRGKPVLTGDHRLPLMFVGRHAEAIAEVRCAKYYAHDYDHAIEKYHKTLDIDRSLFSRQFPSREGYVQKGIYEEALAELREVKGITVEPHSVMANAYAMSGQRHGSDAANRSNRPSGVAEGTTRSHEQPRSQPTRRVETRVRVFHWHSLGLT